MNAAADSDTKIFLYIFYNVTGRIPKIPLPLILASPRYNPVTDMTVLSFQAYVLTCFTRVNCEKPIIKPTKQSLIHKLHWNSHSRCPYHSQRLAMNSILTCQWEDKDSKRKRKGREKIMSSDNNKTCNQQSIAYTHIYSFALSKSGLKCWRIVFFFLFLFTLIHWKLFFEKSFVCTKTPYDGSHWNLDKHSNKTETK